MAERKEGEPQVDAENTQDRTQGFGVDPQARSTGRRKKNGDKPEEKIDPITNQPMSDFVPSLDADDPNADAVRVQNEQIKVGSMMGRHLAAAQLMDTRAAEEARAEQAEENKRITDEANPVPEREYTMIPPDVYRAREQARVMAEAKTLGTNKIQPGGRFKVGDQFVDANGNVLEDQSE